MADLPLPFGLTTRSMGAEDAESVVRLVARATEAVGGRPTLSVSMIQAFLTLPGFDPSDDTVVVADGTGATVAMEVVLQPQPYVAAQVFGAVDPDYTNRGIGTALVAWARQRATEKGDGAPEGARVDMHATVDVRDRAGAVLLEDAGFERSRFFFEMHIDLGGDLEKPRFPPGIEMRPYRSGEEHAVYEAFEDSFRDHWGWVDRPYDEGFGGFWHRLQMDEYDPEFWWVAVEGDEIAAFNVCLSSHGGDQTFAWCDQIGVRRAWRRKGLARAMLLHSFSEFRSRGATRMGLAVDAGSLTGATDLYESIGMEVAEQYGVYELVVREGDSMITEELG